MAIEERTAKRICDVKFTKSMTILIDMSRINIRCVVNSYIRVFVCEKKK